MKYAAITDAQIALLKANPVETFEQFSAPYHLICEEQDDACTIDLERGRKLTSLMNDIPHIALVDLEITDGMHNVRYCAYHDEMFLFVEISRTSEENYSVTALFDKDHEYVLGYLGR